MRQLVGSAKEWHQSLDTEVNNIQSLLHPLTSSFNFASNNLCHSFALLTRRLSMTLRCPPLGTPDYVHQFVSVKTSDWCSQLEKLLSFVTTLASNWIYLSLTIQSINNIVTLLEETIRTRLILTLTGMLPANMAERDLLVLSGRLEGIGLRDPSKYCFGEALQMAGPLKTLISERMPTVSPEALEEQYKAIPSFAASSNIPTLTSGYSTFMLPKASISTLQSVIANTRI